MIVDRSSFAGELLRLRKKVTVARIFNGANLPWDGSGAFIHPSSKGRLFIDIPSYFKSR